MVKKSALLNCIWGFCTITSLAGEEGLLLIQFTWIIIRRHNNWVRNSFFITFLRSHNCACCDEIWMRFASIWSGRVKMIDRDLGSARVLQALRWCLNWVVLCSFLLMTAEWKHIYKSKEFWKLNFSNNTYGFGFFKPESRPQALLLMQKG